MNDNSLKLFSIVLKNYSELYDHFYVIATDTNIAYKIVKKYLDEKKLLFYKERELEKIELVAENVKYPDCERILLIEGNKIE
jgi:hypothetical protein